MHPVLLQQWAWKAAKLDEIQLDGTSRFMHMPRHIIAVGVLVAASLALTTNAPADLMPAASRKLLPKSRSHRRQGRPVDLSQAALDLESGLCET